MKSSMKRQRCGTHYVNWPNVGPQIASKLHSSGMRSFKKPLQEVPTLNKSLIGDRHALVMEKT
jgi:hypothetical protein